MKNMGAATGAGAWPKFTIDRIVCKRLAWPFDTIGRVDSWHWRWRNRGTERVEGIKVRNRNRWLKVTSDCQNL